MQAPCRRTLDQSTKNIFKFSYARDLVGIVSKGTNILSLQGIVLNVAFDSGQLEVQVSKLFKYAQWSMDLILGMIHCFKIGNIIAMICPH